MQQVSAGDQIQAATLTAVKGATDWTVRLTSGEEVKAVLDVEALRKAHGHIYGLNLGGRVDVIYDLATKSARIVRIEQKSSER